MNDPTGVFDHGGPDGGAAADPDPLMSIGMFSRASLVSIKALRAYHEQGLLIPDSIDPDTGYRYYRVSQLPDAEIIRRLRSLDLPLRDVAEVVQARSPEVTAKILAEHESAMRRRLTDVGRIVDELQQAIALPGTGTPIFVRREAATHSLAYQGTVVGDNYADFMGSAFATLWQALNSIGATMTGPSAALYPPEVGLENWVIAYLPIAEPATLPPAVLDSGVRLDLIPGVTAAVMTHIGSFDSIGDTYRQLGAWVARNSRSAGLPVREYHLVSVDPETGQLLPPEQLRTEIVWPIAGDGGATSQPRHPDLNVQDTEEGRSS